jgi:microcystin degradation protein MlrC
MLGSRRDPIVIGDGADATNSGAPGDSTVLLGELIKQQPMIPHGAMTFLVDPKAVVLRFRGTVERLLPMQFELNGALGRKMPIQMGRSAVVRSGDVTVVFTEKSGPGSSPLLYEPQATRMWNCSGEVAHRIPSRL